MTAIRAVGGTQGCASRDGDERRGRVGVDWRMGARARRPRRMGLETTTLFLRVDGAEQLLAAGAREADESALDAKRHFVFRDAFAAADFDLQR